MLFITWDCGGGGTFCLPPQIGPPPLPLTLITVDASGWGVGAN